MKKTKVQDNPESFENKLNKLKDIVEEMNSGTLSLDESLNYFENGIGLYNTCRKELESAELRIKKIIELKDGYKEVDFDQNLEE